LKRRALVTGGSGGIGRAVVLSLATAGHDVVVHYGNNAEKARAVASEAEALGANASIVGFDVRNHDATRQCMEGLLAEGPIDILVNNAGVLQDGPFPTTSADGWHRIIDTTLSGFYHVTQPVVMPMVRRRFGRIINMASISGVIGNRGQVNYSAAKAGLIGATKALAREVAKRGVTVNALAPGLIETEMIEGAHVDEILKHIPMQRMGKPEEVAALCTFLASDIAGYITGQVIAIAGGLG
jgi:3-oxoacyl-[acyl-carrier protein] reductase